MSIIVKGMDMPDNCEMCRFFVDRWCYADSQKRGNAFPVRPHWCPLEEYKEPKTGHWIGEGDGYADGEIVYDTWYCSECDHEEDGEFSALPNFCPNCGADMRGEQDG